jgi:hypothetical protein
MNIRIRSLTIASFVAAAAWVAAPAKASEDHNLAPAHGGVVTESKHLVYELVAKPAAVQLYLRDHGKPVPVAGASAKLTLLAGTAKQDVELKPVGDKLEATGTFNVPAGTKAVAVVSRDGKSLGTARFTLK